MKFSTVLSIPGSDQYISLVATQNERYPMEIRDKDRKKRDKAIEHHSQNSYYVFHESLSSLFTQKSQGVFNSEFFE